MKKIFFILVLTSLQAVSLFAEDFSYSFNSEMQFIRRDISEAKSKLPEQDSKYDFFSFKNSLMLNYKFLEGYAKLNYFEPKYDKFQTVPSIGSEKAELYFDDYFLRGNFDFGTIQLGKFSTSVGSGIMLNAQYDEEFDTDSRIIGAIADLYFDTFSFKAFAGASPWDKPESFTDDFNKDLFRYYETQYDTIVGVDAIASMLDGMLSNGLSIVYHKELSEYSPKTEVNTKIENYVNNVMVGLRNEMFIGNYNSYSEYIFMNKNSDEIDLEEDKGHAFYTMQSYLFENSSISLQYKYLKEFDGKLHDVPTLNHNDDTVFDDASGKHEQGIQVEFTHTFHNGHSALINYAENWTNDKDYQLSNLYAEYVIVWDDNTLKLDYEQFEKIVPTTDPQYDAWEKEMTPHFSYDFVAFEQFPITWKSGWKIVKANENDEYYEPKIQTDIAIDDFGFSIIVDHQFGDKGGATIDFGDKDHFWIGTEIVYNILDRVDMKLFFGKEKEGKVCRNGVCKQQPEFSGIRLDLSTSF